MFGLILTVHVVIAIVLVFVVLLQSGRGSEMGAAFGGIGQASSARGEMSGFAKFTNIIAAVFMITSLGLAYLSSQEADKSVLSKLQAMEADINAKRKEKANEDSNAEVKAEPEATLQQTEAPTVVEPENTTETTLEQTEAPVLDEVQNTDSFDEVSTESSNHTEDTNN